MSNSFAQYYNDTVIIKDEVNKSVQIKKVLSLQLYSSKILINEKARITKANTKLSVYIAKYRQGQ